MHLLDTNVVSELRKVRAGRADPNVAAWIARVPQRQLFVSVISIQELGSLLGRDTLTIDLVRVRAYVDGFNFYKGSLEVAKLHRATTGVALVWKWMDVRQLCANIASVHLGPEVKVTYVGYFTANVRSHFAGDTTPERQRTYLDALEATGVEVIRGKFDIRTRDRQLVMPKDAYRQLRSEATIMARVKLPSEKGSDVNLATWLLRDFYTRRGSFDASVVVSNDGDLWHPVETLRTAGWPVGIVNPHGEQADATLGNNRLGVPQFRHRMTPEDLASAPLPDPVVAILPDGTAGRYDCPIEWKTPPQQ